MTQEVSPRELPFRLWGPLWLRIWGILVTAALVYGVVLIIGDASGYGFATVPIVLFFLAMLYLFARGTSIHVQATDGGVRVFNPLHAYDLRWEEIADVEAINQVGGIGGYARIVRTDGDPITLAVSNFGIRGDPQSALRIATPLKAALDRRRTAATS